MIITNTCISYRSTFWCRERRRPKYLSRGYKVLEGMPRQNEFLRRKVSRSLACWRGRGHVYRCVGLTSIAFVYNIATGHRAGASAGRAAASRRQRWAALLLYLSCVTRVCFWRRLRRQLETGQAGGSDTGSAPGLPRYSRLSASGNCRFMPLFLVVDPT